ncbi:chorismate pyruvate-lyase family protein [Dactylosporangium sp. NPDC051541]|uniref:chorismate--pyruvate lyase family protein n=1 Tax=Dactylosporangium sp. NPDC051541 TaxID=3363977 RepID=UPI0037B665CA
MVTDGKQVASEPVEPGTTVPADALEDAIARIWAEVLSVGAVRHDDDFFELGGDSLLAMRVSSRIRRLLAVDVSVEVMLEASTVSSFAGHVREVMARAGVATPTPTAVPPPVPAQRPAAEVSPAARTMLRNFAAPESRPAGVAELDLDALPATLRCLLVHDGTLTVGLEALRIATVMAEVRTEAVALLSAAESAWLAVEPGTVSVRRRTAIRDATTGELLVEADSLLVPERLPANFAALLSANPRGIGAAMLESRAEFRRELLWYGLGAMPADVDDEDVPAGAPLVLRCYRLVHGGVPIMCIKEGFVLDSSLVRELR